MEDDKVNCSMYWENSLLENNNNNSINNNYNYQCDPFESALSSMVSSPTASNGYLSENNNSSIQVRELIGRLGTICNSSNNSRNNTSCYNTPLNSPPPPPKLNLSITAAAETDFPPFSTDPGFAQRAAAFSCFNRQFPARFEDSRENSSLSEQIPNSRKRKSIPKGNKGKGLTVPAATAKHPNNIASGKNESSEKRAKSEEENKQLNDDNNNNDNINNDNSNNDNSKPIEAPKDYIHVRARRGQATDAHSLAERVRREKISEKMKVLQDLVPGCNKVTGKAVMLDEIINYVQSLQRQAEFLSMKLATVNPRMDFNMEPLMSNSKDIFVPRGSLHQNIYPPESYHLQSIHGIEDNNIYPPINNFSSYAPQVSTFWEDDLHSVVQMGFDPNEAQNFHGIIPTSQMKVEL